MKSGSGPARRGERDRQFPGNKALARTIAALERARSEVGDSPLPVKPEGKAPGSGAPREEGSRVVLIAAIAVAVGLAGVSIALVVSYKVRVNDMTHTLTEMSSYVRLLEAKRLAEEEAYSRRVETLRERVRELEVTAKTEPRTEARIEPAPVEPEPRRKFLGIF